MSFLGWNNRKKDAPAGPAHPTPAPGAAAPGPSPDAVPVVAPPDVPAVQPAALPTPAAAAPIAPKAAPPAHAVPSASAAPGTTLSIKGTIETGEDFEFHGKLEGAIVATGCEISVSSSARIKGDVTAATIVVAGRVDGVLRASDEIELLSTASVAGELVAPRIGMALGAQVRAKVNTSTAEAAMAVAQHRQRSDPQRRIPTPPPADKTPAATKPAAAVSQPTSALP
jgi:cytoskeletal protein CcmA (bactofilin family)